MIVVKSSLETALKNTVSGKVIPILEYAKFTCQDGKLLIETSDLNLFVKTTIEYNGEPLDVFCAPVQRMVRQLSAYKGNEVEITLVDNAVQLKCGRNKCKIPTLRHEDFPDIQKMEEFAGEVKIAGQLKLLNPIVSTEDSRRVLHGINIKNDAGTAFIASTDGKRLGICETAFEGSEAVNAVIPLDACQFLSKIGSLTLSFGETMFKAVNDNVEIIGKLVEGTYPNYRQIIPTSTKLKVTFDGSAVYEALKSIMAFGAENMTLTVKEGIGRFHATTSDTGRADVEFELKGGEPDEVEFMFNVKYFGDGLATGEVSFNYNDNKTPVIMKSEQFEYIIMPLRQR